MQDVAARVLIDAAREAARHAHALHSRFAVGAAILMEDGEIITGTNFENASYGLSLCAETVALATTNARELLRNVVAIGIVGGLMDKAGQMTGEEVVRPAAAAVRC